ncbi:DUF2977 domain-containing protein [Latilactobacillus sakei]|uniref:DUF2977 domain-containing protein n=1 Tax=Latilactobacillus sakei TaxID=1599 RepID=UPI00202DFD7D|nr:DUF2977 domain-containing protein [Latilactobacillus sakei]MCM1597532.1 DUF2977 domain-containing protein [Latilactobacillus sakei]
MQLEINSNNEIIAYLVCGGIDGIELVKYGGAIPDNFEENFKPSFYLLKNNEITVNPDYVPPKPPVVGPGNLDKAIAQLTLQAAQQKVTQDKLNAQILLEIAQLKGGNN